MTTSNQESRLPFWTKLIYGTGDWSTASFGTLRQLFYAIFLTDVVGLEARLASFVALVGIGYTDIYPVERLLRNVRLITIWTSTNEIMDPVIQHEFYKEFLIEKPHGRDVEADAAARLPARGASLKNKPG